MKLLLLVICFILCISTQAQHKGVVVNTSIRPIPTLVHKSTLSGKQPLIIFLHGIGERTSRSDTNDLYKLKKNGITKYAEKGDLRAKAPNGIIYSYNVLSPQLNSGYSMWQNFYVDEMIKYGIKYLNADPSRIYVAGLSLGGGGVARTTGDTTLMKRISAIASACGTCSWTSTSNIKKYKLGVWLSHAADDPRVPFTCSGKAVAQLKAMYVDVWWTPYMEGGHNIWDRFYTTNKIPYLLTTGKYCTTTPNIYEWFLRYKKP